MLQRWRNMFILSNAVTRSTRLAVAATNLASFHSTSAFLEKSKNNSKISFSVREKGPNRKKALQAILYNGGCSVYGVSPAYTDCIKMKRIKPTHHTKRAALRKLKRKPRREKPCDDYDNDPARDFFAAFGKAGSDSNFRRWEQRFQSTENSDSTNSRFNVPGTESMTCAHRKILGLPATGHLKMEDVKTAFRSSALKWHPDRHQCSARAAAEEQFKRCVDAYKSLSAGVSPR